MTTKKKKSSPAPAPSDVEDVAIQEVFGRALDAEVSALFQDVVHEISLVDYTDRLTVPQFTSLAKLVVLDRWFKGPDVDDEQIAIWVGGFNKSDLAKMRKVPEYKKIRTEAEAAFKRLTQETSFEDLSKDKRFQARLFRGHKNLALHARDTRVRERALTSLVDRIAPKLSQTKDVGARVLVLPPAMAGYLEEATRRVQTMQGRQVTGEVVDADSEEVHEGTPASPTDGGAE